MGTLTPGTPSADVGELSLRHRFRSSSLISVRSVITMLGMLGQEDCLKFEASLGHGVTFRVV